MRIFLLFTLFLVRFHPAFADVRTSKMFGDNMVLQRGMAVPVFGWADPGEQVTIDFMDKSYTTTAGTDGKWKLKLGKYKAGGPYQMRINGKSNVLNYSNILIGEVWLASGQSNMEFGIQTDKNGKDAIAKATDNQIHLFYVPMMLSLTRQDDMVKLNESDMVNARWVVCSPEVLDTKSFAWHGFSAVGYYFAQQIRKSTGVPVGMIGSYRGGTPAESWMTREGLAKDPAFTKYVNRYDYLAKNYETAKASYPQRQALYRDSLKLWKEEVEPIYNQTVKQWDADVVAARTNGQLAPVRPKPSRPMPANPADPLGGYQAPTVCFNGVIAPIVGYGIKGVIWYQGESNADSFKDAVEYKDLFPRMITNWRDEWGQGDFPFLYVQLPNFRAAAITPSSGNWPWLREAQEKTLSLPNTGMAVITDAGEAMDIHPSDKSDPGNRLGLVALHDIYGKKVVASGPVYKSMKVDGNKIIISFDDIHKGLIIGRPNADGIVNNSPAELKGFGIAGADHKFVWAKAVMKGNKIIVYADGITIPEAVRYNWADNPPGNLYNKDGLPARPFRTDSWAPAL
ncbi:sialate O-acetylesterase [Mucilaginibacter antarcticus]|uniref:Sialate O-acetylesterase n=1 Tax=Mucilaginibacter antarcticus TaxID=1855725 RepID=A0ABW5XKK0_9SPHI